MKSNTGSARGVGLLAAMVLVSLMAVLAGISAPIANQVMVAQRTLGVRDDLDALKVAIAGNPNLIITEGRADFGYIGTVGDLPTSLSDLWLKASFPGYTFDTSATLVGAGWVGPYVPNTIVGRLLNFDLDPFGTPYTYTSTEFNRSGDNALVAARIASAGPDGIAGNGDDLLVDLLKGEVFSQVTGTAKRNNQELVGATITLNSPSAGVVTQQFTVSDSNGQFTFNDVTFGFRSLSVDPKLTYETGTAKAKNPGSRNLEFKVTNFATNAVSVNSIRLTFPTPTAWFEEVKFGNTTVFDYVTDNSGNRVASGELVNLSSAQQVNGSGKPTPVVPIRVEEEVTVAPDVSIRGIGSTATVLVSNFMDAVSGSASGVSVSGATFTVVFSDGSTNTFTVP